MWIGDRSKETCNFDYRTLDDKITRKHGMTDREHYLYNWGCSKHGQPQEWQWRKNDNPDWEPYQRHFQRPTKEELDHAWEKDPTGRSTPFPKVITQEWERKAMRLERDAVDRLRRKHPTPAKFYDDCKDENGEYKTSGSAATFLMTTLMYGSPEREDPLTALVTSEWFREETDFDTDAPMSLELNDMGNDYIFQGWVKIQPR